MNLFKKLICFLLLFISLGIEGYGQCDAAECAEMMILPPSATLYEGEEVSFLVQIDNPNLLAIQTFEFSISFMNNGIENISLETLIPGAAHVTPLSINNEGNMISYAGAVLGQIDIPEAAKIDVARITVTANATITDFMFEFQPNSNLATGGFNLLENTYNSSVQTLGSCPKTRVILNSDLLNGTYYATDSICLEGDVNVLSTINLHAPIIVFDGNVVVKNGALVNAYNDGCGSTPE